VLNNADLYRARLVRSNLSDSQLQTCILTEAKLNRAYMPGSNLQHASLCSADLSGANLLLSNFSAANLESAGLIRAYLSDVNFTDVNLSNADLNGANLNRVNLDTTKVEGTLFEGNLGLSEQQKSELYDRGASIMPLASSVSPCFPGKNPEILHQFDEAKGDLKYRLLDLEEALQTFQEIILILQREVDDILGGQDTLRIFTEECDRFERTIELHQNEIFRQLDNKAAEELNEWMLQELSEELDDLHQQILKLSHYTELAHKVWINTSEQNSE